MPEAERHMGNRARPMPEAERHMGAVAVRHTGTQEGHRRGNLAAHHTGTPAGRRTEAVRRAPGPGRSDPWSLPAGALSVRRHTEDIVQTAAPSGGPAGRVALVD